MGGIDYKQCKKDFLEMYRNASPLEKVRIYNSVRESSEFWERIHSVTPEHLIISFEKSEKLCEEARKRMLSKQ